MSFNAIKTTTGARLWLNLEQYSNEILSIYGWRKLGTLIDFVQADYLYLPCRGGIVQASLLPALVVRVRPPRCASARSELLPVLGLEERVPCHRTLGLTTARGTKVTVLPGNWLEEHKGENHRQGKVCQLLTGNQRKHEGKKTSTTKAGRYLNLKTDVKKNWCTKAMPS